MAWYECEICGHFGKTAPAHWLVIEPNGKNYRENAMEIAKHMFSDYRENPEAFTAQDGNKRPERSLWDFYRLPFFKFRDEVETWYEIERPRPEKGGEDYDKWIERRRHYFESPEAKFAYGLNFCARDGSAYRQLKAVLVGRVRRGCVDENEEFYPLCIEDEVALLKRKWQLEGVTKEERDDAFVYFGRCSPVVNRILMLNVKDAENCISIARCGISQYFPELMDEETAEIKKSES